MAINSWPLASPQLGLRLQGVGLCTAALQRIEAEQRLAAAIRAAEIAGVILPASVAPVVPPIVGAPAVTPITQSTQLTSTDKKISKVTKILASLSAVLLTVGGILLYVGREQSNTTEIACFVVGLSSVGVGGILGVISLSFLLAECCC